LCLLIDRLILHKRYYPALHAQHPVGTLFQKAELA
jgi:hypothetical protein